MEYHAASVEEHIRKNKNRTINHDFQPGRTGYEQEQPC